MSQNTGRISGAKKLRKHVRWNQPIAKYQSPGSEPSAKKRSPQDESVDSLLVDELTEAIIRASRRSHVRENDGNSKEQHLRTHGSDTCEDMR